MLTGLVSVTFRKLSAPEIVRLTKDAGLDGIEWGGDIHCPPGDMQAAQRIVALMRAHGLKTISYGSYYRAGTWGAFDQVVQTAITLETQNIRIWAGDMPSALASAEVRARIVEDTKRCADMAAANDISVSFEYHANTLTDTLPSTICLLNDVDKDNVLTYWQPPDGVSLDDNILAISRLVAMKKLKNLHVFASDNGDRMPLSHGVAMWKQYIAEAAVCSPALLLEFVRGDDPSLMTEDAQTLLALRTPR